MKGKYGNLTHKKYLRFACDRTKEVQRYIKAAGTLSWAVIL
jgi:hypothetical protein